MNVLRLNPFIGLFLESVDTLAVKLGDLTTSKPTDSEQPENQKSASPVQTTKPASPAQTTTTTTNDKPADGSTEQSKEQSKDEESNLIKSTHTVQVKLADQQADPNSPLYSVKSFEELGLSPELLKGLYAMKFSKPSKIQERALPLLIANPPRNMIGQSQSGTGKTAAFVLTMLTRVNEAINQPQAICLAPSRELARQILDVVQEMSKFTKLTSVLAVKDSLPKGRPVHQQIVVGTPGTVQEVIRRRLLLTNQVKIFVLDEADNMLDQAGLGDQSIRIKGAIQNRDFQVVLFSATFPDHVRRFATRFAPSANEISLKREELSVDLIKQFYMDCDNQEHKYDVLCNLYDILTVSQSIIFCAKRDTADEIAKRMSGMGHAVVALHGKMTPEERDRVMDDFRRGEFKVLITTNVLARGIDILQVTLVINYDLPLDQRGQPDYEAYLHRIGRTGRFGRTGVSVNFVHDKKSWELMHQIETHFQREITRIPTEDWEEVEKRFKSVL
ncbi:P-loop containing nucleoside triphosphate hydrolase protein [Zychaea mexicana]|uniref:P-loop containing nucleoside triphosphate hydrolase protein n=1 Tax=Zychaea mexicana TaxID=64656 RepID=UPI0022FDEFC7|nr:P-loop containing nucleoside triphosphate hydrolase protein [Zychaea mexicana]KAI9490069.1 P-loop containing nucleoside triphosphate hydrolase protein [Zychaea mexicana]